MVDLTHAGWPTDEIWSELREEITAQITAFPRQRCANSLKVIAVSSRTYPTTGFFVRSSQDAQLSDFRAPRSDAANTGFFGHSV